MRNFFLYLSILAFFISCDNKKERSVSEQVSAFISDNDSIVVFGKLDYMNMLTKAEYEKAPKIGPIVSSVVNEFQKVINTNEPFYFALSGPLRKDGAPNIGYAFLSVINADSLVKALTQKGYDLDKEGDLYYTHLNDMSIGVKNHLAILFFDKGKEVKLDRIQSTFKKTEGKISNEKQQEILLANGDMVFGYNIENIFKSSTTQIDNLKDDLKLELENMVKDSYGHVAFHFENGKARVVVENDYSEKLKKELFFKKDEEGGITKKLGKGSPRIGLSMNVDMKKIQSFINKYLPGTIDDLARSFGGPAQMALMMGGQDALAGLLNGEFGLVMFGEPDQFGATVPSFNTYIGLGGKGKSLAEMGVSLLEQNNIKAVVDNKGLTCFSSPDYISTDGSSLELPKGCQFYGKKSFTGFMNLEGMDLTSFQLSGGLKLVELVESIHFEFDEDGGELILETINKKDNVLKQSVDFMLDEFESQLNTMPF